jgi:hypothetical protein
VDVYRLPQREKPPATGRIETWTVLSRTWAEFVRIVAIKKAYWELRTLSVSLVGG